MKENEKVFSIFGIFLVAALLIGGCTTNSQNEEQNNLAGSPPSGGNNVAGPNAVDFVDDDPFMGDENAPVTIVEFSDYQCPFCKRFRDQTLDQLKVEYVDTGKVKFVYRDFPLTSIHLYAQKTAEATECADDQGMFWEYHDIIFANPNALDVASLKQHAATLGLNAAEFNECLDSGKYSSEVSNDLSDGQRAGARGTPFFLIGNTVLSGAQPIEAFRSAIDAQL